MDRSDVDRLLEAAGAQFEAAVAAEENAAADDLALSFLQGTELAVLLGRSPWLLRRPGGGTARVTHVGPDCALATSSGTLEPDLIAPLVSAMFVAGEGAPPGPLQDTFVTLLRRRARSGKRLRVAVGEETIQGRARVVTETHLVLERAHGAAIVPLSEVREVQLDD